MGLFGTYITICNNVYYSPENLNQSSYYHEHLKTVDYYFANCVQQNPWIHFCNGLLPY